MITFLITASITHIWTVIIAYSEGGLLSAILSFLFPVLSEIYWIIVMFGENNTYAIIALIHLIIAIPVSMFSSNSR